MQGMQGGANEFGPQYRNYELTAELDSFNFPVTDPLDINPFLYSLPNHQAIPQAPSRAKTDEMAAELFQLISIRRKSPSSSLTLDNLSKLESSFAGETILEESEEKDLETKIGDREGREQGGNKRARSVSDYIPSNLGGRRCSLDELVSYVSNISESNSIGQDPIESNQRVKKVMNIVSEPEEPRRSTRSASKKKQKQK